MTDLMQPSGEQNSSRPKQIDRISRILKREALFIIIFGLSFVLIALLPVIFPERSAVENPSSLSELLIVGILIVGYGLFEFKLATDFYAMKGWTYGWVEFIVKYGKGGWQFRKSFFREEVRKAFGKPEPEYPAFPEYGPKYENTEKKD